jgi:protein SCO1/2
VRAAASLIVVLVLGALAIWQGTDGLAAFTTEGARRLDVARLPRPLPPLDLEDSRGEATTLASFKGKVVLLDFIYTRCPTLCVALGSSFERLRAEIMATDLQENIVLVSLSFDPDNDRPPQLSDYAERFGGADATWRFLRPRSKPQLAKLLRVAEVIALPDAAGGFVHNAAIHVIDRRGRLTGIVDTEAIVDALALARNAMQDGGE